MLENTALKVIGIDMKPIDGLMRFCLVVDMLPLTDGPTLKSETIRLFTGKSIHPEMANPPTFRSLN